MTSWLRPVGGRMVTWIPVILVLTAFAPYLSKERGVRVENLAGAILAIWAGLVVLNRARIQAAMFPAIALSGVLFAHIVGATILNGSGSGLADLKLGIGRLDHYSRPVAVMLICSVALVGLNRAAIEEVLVRCCKVLLALATGNGVVQVLTLFMKMDWFVAPFRPSGGITGMTVAEMAAGGSRVVGIFNQPIEHGAVYAVALVIWVWLWRERRLSMAAAFVTLLGIGIGGALATSKVFLFGGIPAAFLLFFLRPLRPRDVALASGVAVAMVFAFGAMVTIWRGGESILNLLSMLTDRRLLLYALSGGRFGGEDYLTRDDLTTEVLHITKQSPLFGVGAGHSFKLQDNEYLMALGEGGVFALILVLLRISTLVRPALRYRVMESNAATLLALVFVLALGSMGGPISGIPRSGTVLWVFIGIFMLLVSTTEIMHRRTPAATS